MGHFFSKSKPALRQALSLSEKFLGDSELFLITLQILLYSLLYHFRK